MADKKKPRDEGLGDYAKDFVGNLFGRKDDDDDDKAQDAPHAEAQAQRPRDKGIGEYTKDFAKGLFGRDDDDDVKQEKHPKRSLADELREKAQQADQKARAEGKHDSMGDAVQRAAEQARAETKPADNIGEAVKRAAEAARNHTESQPARNAPQNYPPGVSQKIQEAAEATRQRGRDVDRDAVGNVQGQSHAPRVDSDNAANDDELQHLRDRIKELEGQVTSHSAPAQAAPQHRTYTVVPGDSLRAIARRMYGDEMQWRRIYDANRDKISNPDLIYAGQEFVVPE